MRSGDAYVADLRDGRSVFLDGERVGDVTKHPAFAEPIRRIAETAWQVNETTENIGARRLYTIMEKLLEDISFEAPDMPGKDLTIDAEYVRQRLADIWRDQDLSRYIL